MTNPITYVDTLNAALANNELESGTGISAGTLTGTEVIPVSRGAGPLQTTASSLAALVMSGLAPQRQSIPITSAGQPTYTTQGYTPGLIDVFVSGIRLNPSQYQALDGVHITITDAGVLGNLVTGMTVDLAASISIGVSNVAISNITGSEIISTRQGAGLFQTSLSKIAAFALLGISGSTLSAAAALTGSETIPMGQGGLVQSSLTNLAQWVTQTYQGFVQSGTGATSRTVDSKLLESVSVKDFGAKGDGVTNDTSAINAALNSGALNVFLPLGTYIVSGGGQIKMAVNGQRLYGPGTIQQTNASFTSGVIYATQLSNISIDGITIVAPGNYQASGVMLVDCAGASVKNCKISNHGYGVYLYSNGGVGNTYFEVTDNQFSAAASNPSWGMSSSTDVYVLGNAAYGMISRNRCSSAGGYGVALEAINTTDQLYRIAIADNIISGYNSYGIMLYRNGPYVSGTTAAVQHNVIVNNVVDQISGARTRTPGGTDYVFGAGIYIQGAEDSLVLGNKLSNTNTATTVTSLAPGAIGLGSVGRAVVANNEITSPAQYGVYVTDTFYNGYQPGAIQIDNNLIQGAGAIGVYIVLRSQVYVRNNSIIGCVSHGIATSSNTVNLYCEDLLFSNNGIVGCGGSGISLNSAIKAAVRGNKIDGRQVSTAQLVATVTGGVVTGLTIVNPGAAGLFSSAPTIVSTNDTGSGFAATISVSGGQLTTPVIVSGGTTYSGPPSIQLVGGIGRGGLQGVDVSQCQDVWVEGNDIVFMNSRGIDMESSNNASNNAALNFVVRNNVVKYCSVSYQIDCATYLDNNSSFSASTADYSGLCNPYSSTTTLATATSGTINVANYRELTLAPTAATSYTTLQNGAAAQVLTIYAANANATIVNGATIRLSGSTNFVMNSGSSLTLKYIGTVWQEISRCV
jgi:hypothetical protein